MFALQDFDDQTKDENIWVAETETLIIGFVSVWTPDNFVHHLFVHPDYIRKGIGKSLLNFCVSGIPKPLTLKCLENNVNALVFYASQGWKIKAKASDSFENYFLLEFE